MVLSTPSPRDGPRGPLILRLRGRVLSKLLASLLLPLFVLLATACASSVDAPSSEPEPEVTVDPAAQVTVSPAATQVPASASAATGRATLNAVGDLMLDRDIITLMDENGSVYPFAAVLGLLADADITIANMEGTFTERGIQADKFYTFRTPPRHAAGLAQAGIDVVSLGNNHAMDFGGVGLQDTLDALDAAGVRYSGAGSNATEARQAAFLERNGLRLAFLSYNGVSEATFAGPASAGVAIADAGSIIEDVTDAKLTADIVIVSLHAGVEYTDTPTRQQRTLATAAIDAGASVVLGHHAHVLQGWQEYGDGVIVWGLGNFVFDLDYDDLETLGPRPFQTLVLRFELTRDGVESVNARPVYIDPAQNRPVPATGERLSEIEARIQRLNAALQ